MILAAHSLLENNLHPTREDIVDSISGNICRCTGYGQIVEAIQLAAERLRGANVPRHPSPAPPATYRDIGAAGDAPQQGIIKPAKADTPHGGAP
jgi:carbon-monoxide dehydrogenase small subunit